MKLLLLELGPYLALAAQGALMTFDEGLFHRWRRLSRLESYSHLVDTSLVVLTLALAVFAPPQGPWLAIFVGCSALSCLLITKDEWIHTRECSGGEHFCHALLFIVHPLVLISMGLLWYHGENWALRVIALVATAMFGLQQWVFWLLLGNARTDVQRHAPNNEFYDQLGPLWFDGDHHAQALYRSEHRARLAYIRELLQNEGVPAGARVLDIGCGAGLTAAPLADAGFEVKGVDTSAGALAAARSAAPRNGALSYAFGDAYQLGEEPESFDVVILLSILDRLESPDRVLQQAVRVLKPGGLLIVGAMNRTLHSWAATTQGIKLLVDEIPPNLFVHRLFIKPNELAVMASREGLELRELCGFKPRLFHKSVLLSVLHHRLHPEFSFVRTPSLSVGYVGYFVKQASRVEERSLVGKTLPAEASVIAARASHG